MRLDKWLWAARFFRTRALAQQAIEAGRVRVGGERVKPSKAVRTGDLLAIRIQEVDWEIAVRGLSERRGPAAAARLLYEEQEESRRRRARAGTGAARPADQAGPARAAPAARLLSARGSRALELR
jgi:ribosome-associated heat shock protein Hsp15